MARVELTPVQPWQVEYLAVHMRAADVAEVRMLEGLSPREALRLSLESSSRCACGMVDGVPQAIFGVAPCTLLGDTGFAWMLGAEGIERHSRIFVPLARKVIAAMFEDFPVLMNVVHAGNRLSIAWLRRLGATFTPMGDRVYFQLRADRETAAASH